MQEDFADRVIAGKCLNFDELMALADNGSAYDLFAAALKIKRRYSHDSVDLCSIINAKSGACSEDCSYCAQSSRSSSDSPVYPLLEERYILEKAEEAKENQVKRFCIVTSGRAATNDDLKKIAHVIRKIRDLGLLPCSTLGLLDRDGLKFLKDAGLERYHHNLETSERYFPALCSTHTYEDKVRTIEAVKEVGLSLCSGGIFGMGETWQDRIDMAWALRDLEADSIPINFLIPIKGTSLSDLPMLDPLEALKIISCYRFILPERQIRVCGGRMQTLGELNPLIFLAGADGLLVGNYLTTLGRDYQHDIEMIRMMGLGIG